MKNQFANNVVFSVYLWTEHELLQKGEAYINNTSKLYYTADSRQPTKVAYSAPFKQWVYDSGVNGANIPTSISGSFGIINKGESGLMFDFDNGRVLLNSGVGKNLNITGSYSIKEVNFYISNETEENIIINDKYFFNPRYANKPTSGIAPYAITTPAIFIVQNGNSSTPFALGGMMDTKMNMSLIVMAESSYQLSNILSFFNDKKHKYIPLMDLSLDPINEYGDLKSGYNYNLLSASFNTPGNLLFIEEVDSSILSDELKTNYKIFLGEIDLTLSYPRYINN